MACGSIRFLLSYILTKQVWHVNIIAIHKIAAKFKDDINVIVFSADAVSSSTTIPELFIHTSTLHFGLRIL